LRHSKNRPGHNGAATANPALWKPYLDVIREKCSQAWHIFDRFHIVAKMNKALDEVRAGESRKMASTSFPTKCSVRWNYTVHPTQNVN
jgi:transposase